MSNIFSGMEQICFCVQNRISNQTAKHFPDTKQSSYRQQPFFFSVKKRLDPSLTAQFQWPYYFDLYIAVNVGKTQKYT